MNEITSDYSNLVQCIQKVVQGEQCLLYDLEMPGVGPGRTLRVFIHKEGEAGVDLDDCSRVSRRLNLVLDVEDLVPGGAYDLEVSSPGLERRLTQPWHFQQAVGEEVDFQLNRGLGEFVPQRPAPEKKRKKLRGILEGVKENELKVTLEETSLTIPMEYVHKAKVVYSFEESFVERGKRPKKTKPVQPKSVERRQEGKRKGRKG